jgi:hypothetical protein
MVRLPSLIACCLVLGCSTMRPGGSQHPGIVEKNPSAVTRTFDGSATLVAQTMADVMSEDAILENISMTPDVQSREFRNFSRADRQALNISQLTPANDVNFNIKARCKDGSPVAVAVRLKGEAGCEVSVLYGFSGEPDLSRDLLDKAQAALASPRDAAVAKTAASKSERPGRSSR